MRTRKSIRESRSNHEPEPGSIAGWIFGLAFVLGTAITIWLALNT